MVKRGAKKVKVMKVKKSIQKVKKVSDKKLSFSDFLIKPFEFYFKNLHIALPFLIWLIIVAVSVFIAGAILFTVFSEESLKAPLTAINQSQSQDLSFLLTPYLLKFLISLLIAIGIIFLIATIASWFFTSSTLVFARNVVNGKKEGQGFKTYLKKSFSYSYYWWKYALVKILQGLIVLVYAFILVIIFIGLSKVNIALSLIVGFILAILGFFGYLFIAIPQYCLVYLDVGIFKSFRASVKIVKQNYLEFLGLFVILSLFGLIGWFIFSFVYLGWFFNFLFFIQYSSLVYMLFIKERLKRVGK